MMLLALQMDQELAVRMLFKCKSALNYATHAAAQQVDEEKLSRGIHDIDPLKARQEALFYLRENLRLDEQNEPLPGSVLGSKVEVLAFDVISGDADFPFVYVNEEHDFSTVFARPGVVMIIRVEYPRVFRMMGPVTWEIKSASELVY